MIANLFQSLAGRASGLLSGGFLLKTLAVFTFTLAIAFYFLWNAYGGALQDGARSAAAVTELAGRLEDSERDKANLVADFEAERARAEAIKARLKELNARRLADIANARRDYEDLQQTIGDSLAGQECRNVPVPAGAIAGLQRAASRANGIPDGNP